MTRNPLRAHPFGVALKGDRRHCVASSNPACLCRGFELNPMRDGKRIAVFGPGVGVCRLRDSKERNNKLFRKRLSKSMRRVTPREGRYYSTALDARGVPVARTGASGDANGNNRPSAEVREGPLPGEIVMARWFWFRANRGLARYVQSGYEVTHHRCPDLGQLHFVLVGCVIKGFEIGLGQIVVGFSHRARESPKR